MSQGVWFLHFLLVVPCVYFASRCCSFCQPRTGNRSHLHEKRTLEKQLQKGIPQEITPLKHSGVSSRQMHCQQPTSHRFSLSRSTACGSTPMLCQLREHPSPQRSASAILPLHVRTNSDDNSSQCAHRKHDGFAFLHKRALVRHVVQVHCGVITRFASSSGRNGGQ